MFASNVAADLALPVASPNPSYSAGMWSWSRVLGLETFSRTNNVSSRSRLGQSAQRLGLGPIRLGPRVGLGPKCLGVSGYFMSLVETFCAACAQYSRRRPIPTNLP